MKKTGYSHPLRNPLTRIAQALRSVPIAVALLWGLAATAQQRVTLRHERAALRTVLEDIQRQTAYQFILTSRLKNQAKPVTINVAQEPLIAALDKVFREQPLTYELDSTTIIIKERPSRAPAVNAGRNGEAIALRQSLSGRLIDSLGQPISGATIRLVRAPLAGAPGGGAIDRAATSDRAGFFSLGDVEAGAILRITHMSYEPLEIAGNSNLNGIRLRLKSSALDEVQVIGYGTTSRRLSTGNVASVQAEAIENQPVSNPLLTLQGRVAGLSVIQPSGMAGGGIRVRVQGQNSIANGSLPLYVVDGVPIISELPATGVDHPLGIDGPRSAGYGSPLNYLNPGDIERIDVLKDADATAIYGSLAANGAILITTKSGQVGPMRFEVRTETGFGQVANRVEMLNTRQYLDMRYEAFRNDGIDWRDPRVAADDLKAWDTTRYTDWQQELIGGTARYGTTNASVSGGIDAVRYRLSAAYQHESTVFPIPSDFNDRKVSVSSNIRAESPGKRFHLQFTGNYLVDRNQLPYADMTRWALLMQPHAYPLRTAEGSINWVPDATGRTTFYENPMMVVDARYRNRTANLIGNLVLGFRILEGLEFSANLGYNDLSTDDFKAEPLSVVYPENRANTQPSALFGSRTVRSWIVEPQFNYGRALGAGRLEALLGATLRDLRSRSGHLGGLGFLTDSQLENIDAAAVITSEVANASHYRYNALFARLNYTHKDRYIVNLTGRRDGSSRFGGANRFGNFGSLGAAWIITEEDFVPEWPILTFAKLRGSYGLVGNDQIGDYRYLSLFDFANIQVPYQGVVSILPSEMPNPHIQWEETRKLQLGLDVGLLGDRVLLTGTYARNRSSNQLLGYALPYMAGHSNYITNFPALVQNSSWEFTASSDNIVRGRFRWSTTLNMTLPDNRLLAFPDLAGSTYASTLVIGQPVFVNRFYRFSRVDPATGRYQVYDRDGGRTFSPNPDTDRTANLHTQEDFYGGLGNSLTWRGLTVDFLLQFVQQRGYEDLGLGSNFLWTPGSFYPGVSNQPVSVMERWQQPGDRASVARFTTQNSFGGLAANTDVRIVDASFIRLKNVALAYTLPERWLRGAGINQCRLHVNAQNLYTFTGYTGLDPETQSIIALPPLRVVTAGIQLSI